MISSQVLSDFFLQVRIDSQFRPGGSQFRPGRFSISSWDLNFVLEVRSDFFLQVRIESQFRPPGPNWKNLNFVLQVRIERNFVLQVLSDFVLGPK